LLTVQAQPKDKNAMKLLATLAIAALIATGCAMTDKDRTPADVRNNMLVGESGMTLYTFDRDVAGSGKSVCNGPCATNWPPLIVIGDAQPVAGYTIVVRDDGRKQWAYKGKPLYFWAKDTKVGDTSGDNVNNVWHIAKP
jgi:predicted lipoprotein with Yx(FWY)xxD motif